MVFREFTDQIMAAANTPTVKCHQIGPSLVGLPQDLLQGLYQYLNVSDRLSLARSCKYLHSIHASSKLLQYCFTLDTSGYINVAPQPHDRPRVSATQHIRRLSSSSDGSSGSGIGGMESSSGGRQQGRPPLGVTFAITSSPTASRHVQGKIVDAFSSPLEKNLVLRDRERRWETLSPAAVTKFTVSGPAGVYELQEGIFLICDEYSQSDEDTGRPTSIRLIPLPTAQDPYLESPIIAPTSHKVPFPIADLTMDPTQDLIVISEHRPFGSNRQAPTHRYHLLTLSTFEPHPLADSPILDFPPACQAFASTRQLLQVMGDTLVILVSRYQIHWLLAGLQGLPPMGSEEEIVCWNWKTGKVLARMFLPENGWFASFALLTPTSFMLTSTSNISAVFPPDAAALPASLFPPVIKIYSFLPDPDNTIDPSQPLCDDANDDTTPRPTFLAQLDLPRFATGTLVDGVDVRPDPAAPPSNSPGLGNVSKPFTQDPSKGILVFEISVREPPDPILDPRGLGMKVGYELFVLRETLVDLARDGELKLTQQRIERKIPTELSYWPIDETIPWASWGEKQSRLMDMSMRKRTWVCSCSGYRFVSLVTVPGARAEEDDDHELVMTPPIASDVRLLDFSPYNIRKPLYTEKDDAAVTTHLEPTVLSKRRVWSEDVKTMLPYTEVYKRIGDKANGVIMDGERIIGVCTRGSRNGDWSTIRQEMTVYCM